MRHDDCGVDDDDHLEKIASAIGYVIEMEEQANDKKIYD